MGITIQCIRDSLSLEKSLSFCTFGGKGETRPIFITLLKTMFQIFPSSLIEKNHYKKKVSTFPSEKLHPCSYFKNILEEKIECSYRDNCLMSVIVNNDYH